MPSTHSTIAPRNSSSSLNLLFPFLIVLSVVVVIVPVPAMVLDLLLAANITGAMIILLTTIFVSKPLDFSVFPSLLLVATLARLVLNVASTRLILTRGATHETHAAGEVIQAFSRFVAQDQLVVGLILFSILVVIQFVVVTKGATRLSEVAARFSLDGMPGKQMAIDADLKSGHITSDEARRRREEVTAQADFHAAMDGAGKFVRGDAVAGILITLINIVGGLFVGIVQHRMEPIRAVEVFTMLTIGDGLVTQVPGFLIALAAALLATRSSTDSQLSRDVVTQTLREPAVMYFASAGAVALAFTGLPMLPLTILGTGCAFVGETLRRQRRTRQIEEVQANAELKRSRAIKPSARPEDHLLVEPIELELGFRLIRLANPDVGGDLMERVSNLRHRFAQELGIILPKVKIRDSLRVRDRGYLIRFRGVAVASGELIPESLLAVDTGLVSGELAGAEIQDPATHRPAKWIEPSRVDQAKELGYKIVEPSNVVIAHLAEVVRGHADELLTRQQVHELLENLRRTAPRVIEELIPGLLKPSQIHQILGNLLRERVPIRDLEEILETLGDHVEQTKNPTLLTEHVRRALGRTICQPHQDATGVIRAITIDPALEDVLSAGFDCSEQTTIVRLTPQVTDGVAREVARQVKKVLAAGQSPVLVSGPRSRPVLRQILSAALPRLAILSLNEIPRGVRLQSVAQIPMNAIKLPSLTMNTTNPSNPFTAVERFAAAS